MELPFTVEQFLDVFRSYNMAIWPMQIVAYALAFAIIILAVRPTRHADRIIGGVLAFFWLWNGAIYHLTFFSTINPAAYVFGTLFVLEGLMFLAFGTVAPKFAFRFRRDVYGLAGGLLMLYALLIYSTLGTFLGHGYPLAPLFGVAPCPTTIFTFSMLLWSETRVPIWLVAIPTLWALVGTTAAFQLGIVEDLGLIVAALVTLGLLIYRNRTEGAEVAPRSVMVG